MLKHVAVTSVLLYTYRVIPCIYFVVIHDFIFKNLHIRLNTKLASHSEELREVSVQMHHSNSALCVGEWSASRSIRFIPVAQHPVRDLELVETLRRSKKLLIFTGLKPRVSVFQTPASSLLRIRYPRFHQGKPTQNFSKCYVIAYSIFA